MKTGEGASAHAGARIFALEGQVVLQAEDAVIDPGRAEIVTQSSFASEKGVALKADMATNVGSPGAEPDLVFKVRAARAGRYVIRTHAATDARGSKAMREARSKFDSLFLTIAVGDGRPTRRVVFVPWSRLESCTQSTGKFDLNGREQEIRIWLPEGVRLDYLEVSPYRPPEVPSTATDFQPSVVPPASRPRIWVNEQSLPAVRANLTKRRKRAALGQVRETAAEPFEVQG